MAIKYEKHTKIQLQQHPILNEKWVQERIAEDPIILGLGDVILRDKERIQHKAGRLDLLLQDAETNRRYEVEIQLGKTDESHIIRTLEYWDIEKKRYPQYDHVAVIVAEEITSRFLNVISLFNGTIPLIAIQFNAIQIGDSVALVFTTVLNEIRRGLVDEDESVHEITDRNYWEGRGTKNTVNMADELLELVKKFHPKLELKYNKFYIGLAEDGQPNNFVIFRPQKSAIRVEVRVEKSDAIEQKLTNSGLDLLDYDAKWGRYRIRLEKGDVKKHEEMLQEIFFAAYGGKADE